MTELGTSAMEVDPSRISLPDPSVAGILDPTQHLTGQRLADFLAMAVNIPKVCNHEKIHQLAIRLLTKIGRQC